MAEQQGGRKKKRTAAAFQVAAPAAQKGLPPRIGYEAMGKRLATVWTQNPDDVHVKDVTPAKIAGPLGKAEDLVEPEERARKAYLKAAADHEALHDQRVGYVKQSWKDFLVVLDHLRAAAKHDAEVRERYQFVFDFMALKRKKAPRGGGPK